MPILKETIEILFQESLVKVLFSTETFSMGYGCIVHIVPYSVMEMEMVMVMVFVFSVQFEYARQDCGIHELS